jgi:hypothetical protein
LGHADPDLNWDYAKRYPEFPIVLSDGVPFFVIRGYQSGGYTGDTAEKCIEQCEHFSIVTNDLRTEARDEAARDLIATEGFKRLYNNSDDVKPMSEMISAQAR